MFKAMYQKLHQAAAPEPALLDEVIRQAKAQERKAASAWQRWLCGAAAAAVCVCGGLPLAAASSAGYQLMYSISPSAAQFFVPVQRSDEDNGIRMEVESAYIHDNTAEIYISFQDLEGDRLDGTTDLCDSYSIHRPFSSAGGCIPQGYDEETGKVRFLILISEWGSQKISGKKLTFSVRELLSGRQTYNDIPIPVDLSAVGTAAETREVRFTGGTVPEGMDPGGLQDLLLRALEPGEPMQEFPVDGIEMTGIGYIDGKLHIQTRVHDLSKFNNHGYFFLQDSAGNQIQCEQGFYFREYESSEDRLDYHDYVFDVPQESLADYQLYGWFRSDGETMRGNWRVSFPIENYSAQNAE